MRTSSTKSPRSTLRIAKPVRGSPESLMRIRIIIEPRLEVDDPQ